MTELTLNGITELADVGRQIEADLVLAFEPVGLHAEERHARELG